MEPTVGLGEGHGARGEGHGARGVAEGEREASHGLMTGAREAS